MNHSMKYLNFFLLILIFNMLCVFSFSQKLTLTDLINLCSKKNWVDVNHVLLAKGWTYYDSQKGDSYKYNTITWSYEKNYYNNKAQGWFYLYTYEGFPNQISYSIFNKESYSIIQNSINSAGYKLIKSEIEDNEVISTYDNANYILKISNEKRKDDDYTERSLTAYNITLIKKEGIYDPNNGKKVEYYYGDKIQVEYTLLNGKINGQLKAYHYNGKLKKVGFYSNDKENGIFKEFDENGNLVAEYSMSNGDLNGLLITYYSNGNLKKKGNYLNGKEQGNFIEYDENGDKLVEYEMSNGMKNGVLKVYEDGKINASTTFKDDVKNGQRIEYYYDDETGQLQLKQIEEYINDEKNGTWKLLFVEEDNTERLLKYENYTRDVKSGFFQDVKGDSLIIGNYKNGKLHGDYKVYRDFVRFLFGGVIRTDTSKLTLISEGIYYEGLESGYWKEYYLTGTLKSEGRYLNGQKTGEWKYYYTRWDDGKGGEMPYSKQLFLVQNYSNGKLDGKSTRFSYLNEENYPCSETDENKNPLDTCTRYIYQKILETSFYKNDKLNGPFELKDSTNQIIVNGFFKDDLKDGEWLYRYSEKDYKENPYYIYQKGNYTKDKREGKWIQYYKEDEILKTFNYKNGVLHGEYIEWNNQGDPIEKKQFKFGKMTELITYDRLGKNIENIYEIFDEKDSSYKCLKTQYLKNGYTSQEYLIKKQEDIDHNIFEFLFELFVYNSNGTMGYKDGDYNFYDYSDKLITSGKYYKENRVGLWTYYFHDQNVKIKSNFLQDKMIDETYLKLNGDAFTGEFVYYDDENGITEKRKIKEGLRNGKTVYIDTNTKKTIKKENYKNGVLK